MNKATATPHLSRSAWALKYPSQFWGERIRERVASQVDHIRHWSITHASYVDIPDGEATWFVDPPYVVAGHRYRHGSRQIDYAHLAEWCRALSGQVMVCEAEGATWLPFEPFHIAKATSGHKRAGTSRELIWRTA